MPPKSIPAFLEPGSIIEISSDEPGFRGSWYLGTLIRQTSNKTPRKFLVQYSTLFSDGSGTKPLREIVDIVQLRPPPPKDTERDFAVGDEVDAYYNDGWWEGVVTGSEDGMFSVFFRSSREQIKFGKQDLRVHREWTNEKWNPPPEENGRKEMIKKASRKAKEGPSKAISKIEFSSGTLVEVSSDEEGFEGCWFAAKIIETRGEDRYLVEYQTLRAEDGIVPLQEEIDYLHIRPPPPSEAGIDFTVGQKVDAFYNDGWWEGVVTEVLKDGRFGVFFKSSKEKIRFGRRGLRLHRIWVDGEWELPGDEDEDEDEEVEDVEKEEEDEDEEVEEVEKEDDDEDEEVGEIEEEKDEDDEKDSSKSKAGSKKADGKQEFSNGSLIEVSSDEEGFEGAWFAAKIIKPCGKDKYLIEYKNLKAEDETPLREECDVQKIRPEPPETVTIGGFSKLEEVDALYNDGWWTGVISKVHVGSKYLVYFRDTEEELKFDHSELRPHQEWINGKWIWTSKKMKL